MRRTENQSFTFVVNEQQSPDVVISNRRASSPTNTHLFRKVLVQYIEPIVVLDTSQLGLVVLYRRSAQLINKHAKVITHAMTISSARRLLYLKH